MKCEYLSSIRYYTLVLHQSQFSKFFNKLEEQGKEHIPLMLQIKNKSIFFFYKFNVFYKDQNLILIVIYHNSNDNFKSHISFREHKEGDIKSSPLYFKWNEEKPVHDWDFFKRIQSQKIWVEVTHYSKILDSKKHRDV